jgi:signal transduction histidine kinase
MSSLAQPRSDALTRLVAVVQELSRVRTVEQIRSIVRQAARQLTGADGATFVLRDGGFCHYVDEDAIAPLWKGQRFPLSACVSGWAMVNRQAVAIEDVFQDPRVPVDAYRQTFVRSMVMVPIRCDDPIGAIGTYWSTIRRATPEEIDLLQALANTVAVAMENVRVYAELEQRVRERTLQLEHANEELESFAGSVSHDLRAPLGVIQGAAEMIRLKAEDSLDRESLHLLRMIPSQVTRMSALIDDLLRLARIRNASLQLERVDLQTMAQQIAAELTSTDRDNVTFIAQTTPAAAGDAALLRIALQNLLANSWKFTRNVPHAAVAFGAEIRADGIPAYFVRDNGAGFKPEDATRLFTPFQRLHSSSDYAGTGVGLTIVARIIEKHGGRVWAEGAPGEGATFSFTLGASPLDANVPIKRGPTIDRRAS